MRGTHLRTYRLAFAALLVIGVAVCAWSNDHDLPPGLYASIETNRGTIIAELFYERTPLTVANFVGLAEGRLDSTRGKGTPYFDGLTFHRVIEDFMIQGGDPEGNGTGGPGYTFADETRPDLAHDGPGVLSMANRGPNTNGSQFFITHKATPWLDGKHTVFGRVVQGQDVVNSIRQGDRMNRVRILRVGSDAEGYAVSQTRFDALREGVREQQERLAEMAEEDAVAFIEENWPEAQQTKSGMYYVVEKRGRGTKPRRGATVAVHYTGRLLDGTVFDSSIARDEPMQFAVGTGRMIRGFDEAVQDMRRGEKRTIILPPELGYGDGGAQGVIPPNAYLVFEIELLRIN